MAKSKSQQNSSPGPLLDLHGATEDAVFDLVDRFITKHAATSTNQIRIMPGKGKGIVKKKLIEYLKLANYTYKHEKLPNGTLNEGVFVVFL